MPEAVNRFPVPQTVPLPEAVIATVAAGAAAVTVTAAELAVAGTAQVKLLVSWQVTASAAVRPVLLNVLPVADCVTPFTFHT